LEDLPIDEQEFEDYKASLDLYEVKQDTQKQKTSILDDIDFELELIHRELAYIPEIGTIERRKKELQPLQKKNYHRFIGWRYQLRSKEN
jgi:type I restriction enzyme R subunit